MPLHTYLGFFGTGNGGAAIRLENVTRHFGRVAAVLDMNLSVKRGEFLTLLGPSGSGKTTTLMMIAGFVTPSAGQIYLGERPIVDVPPHRRHLGVVFQNYALFPHLTVAENVAFPLEVRRVAKPEVHRRVKEVLEMVELVGLDQRKPHQLSGGQQQRVALARAIVFEPRALLMDEPLGALDRKLRLRMQSELKQLHRRLGITVVHVTHDQEEALAISDRIAVMNGGRVEQVGTPRELYEEPANAFVADFIGESNLLPGVVAEVRDGLATCEGPGGLGFVAAQREGVPIGASVQALVRPEHLALRPRGDAGPATNRWPCRVSEVAYSGKSIRYRVLCGRAGDPRSFAVLTVELRNGEADGRPEVGDEVDAVWEPSHTQLLPV